MGDQNLIDRYVEILFDSGKLIKASKTLIRKKRSALARKIENGNLKATIKAAHDVFNGSLTPDQKNRICQMITNAINQLHKEAKKTAREIIGVLVGTILGILTLAGGLIFSILWVLKERLYEYICPDHCVRVLP